MPPDQSISPASDSPSHEQEIFWQEFVQLKADTCYVRDCRNALSKWVTGLAALRAITSTGSIAGWLVWKRYALLWAALIAIAQLADALKDVFPFYKRRVTLSRWCRALNQLFVEAQRDWDDIAGGIYTDAQVRKLLHRLRSRKQKAEERYAPEGLPDNERLLLNARSEAVRFLETRYHRKDS